MSNTQRTHSHRLGRQPQSVPSIPTQDRSATRDKRGREGRHANSLNQQQEPISRTTLFHQGIRTSNQSLGFGSEQFLNAAGSGTQVRGTGGSSRSRSRKRRSKKESSKSRSKKKWMNWPLGKDKDGKKTEKIPKRTQSHKKHKAYSPSYMHLQQTDTSESEADPDYKKPAELTEEEEEFFGLVTSGAVHEVIERISSPGFNFNMNAVNMEGNTVLHIAVLRQDESMIEVLSNVRGLERAVVYDALLHAIKERSVGLVRSIHALLKADANGGTTPTATTKGADGRALLLSPANFTEIHKDFENSKFPAHTTPLLLAAQIGCYELIEYFHEQGDEIPKPHPRFCTCSQCTTKGGELQRCYRRLHTYQAVCNPHYLCFKTVLNDKFDPILESFKLVKLLEQCIVEEPSFRSAYAKIIQDLKQFTCDLVGQCGSPEVELLLKQKEGYHDANFGEPEVYPRAALAIQWGHKEFISHQFVQKVLYEQWAGKEWPEWKVKSSLVKFLHVVFRILWLWPIVVIITCSNFGNSLRAPINRCINAMASYILFLSFLFIISVSKKPVGDRGPPKTGVELFVIIWELGHIASMVLQAIKTPGFFKSKWTYVEILTHLCFIVVFIFWGIAYYQPTKLRIPRQYWPNEFEPIIIAESFFAIAEILSYAKVLRVLQLHDGLGRVITSLGQMVNDVLHIFSFFFIIICSFAMGLNFVYRHLGKALGENEAFTTFKSSVATLFWSLYALGGDPVHMEEIIDGKQVYYLKFTRGVGEVIYEVYYVIATIFLLNLLLAAMASTYEGLTDSDSASVEWNFVRASLWTSYAREFEVPSPFNLFPLSFPCLLRCFKRCRKKAYDEESAKDLETRFEYYNLVFDLVFRYFRHKAETSSVQPASMDHVTALGEDLAELRSKMTPATPATATTKSQRQETETTTTDISNVKRKLIFEESDDDHQSFETEGS